MTFVSDGYKIGAKSQSVATHYPYSKTITVIGHKQSIKKWFCGDESGVHKKKTVWICCVDLCLIAGNWIQKHSS